MARVPRYRLSPGELRSWRAVEPAARDRARQEIRRTAVERARGRGEPLVIICDKAGRELERLYLGDPVELDPARARVWAGPSRPTRDLLVDEVRRICEDRFAGDEKARSVDVRGPAGELLERVERRGPADGS